MIGLGLTLLIAPLLGADPAYRWPVDLPREITSSFGEYRDGRFHAGIDIRTGGKRPVLAIAGGHVARVRCGPSGYGKALYLQQEDGRLAVYAHLDAFSPELEEFVRAAQHAAKSYTVELTPGAEQFPVKQGDRIATSGQTGTTAHHLHFELREPDNQPVDPFTAGLTWPDTTRPVLQRIAVVPLDTEARVEGDLLPRTFPLTHLGNGQYKAAPVQASGRVALGLEFIDPAPGGAKLSVQQLRLLQDDAEKFHISYDAIHYDDIGDGAVAYHPYLRDEGRFLLLWRWPGNDCGFYTLGDGDGSLSMPPTLNSSKVTLRLRDVGGNESTVEVPFQNAPSTAADIPPSVSGSGTWDLEFFGQMLLIEARFSGPESEAPRVFVAGPTGQTDLPVLRINATTFRAALQPEESGQFRIHLEHPRIPAREELVSIFLRGGPGYSVSLGEVEAAVESDAPYGMLPLRLQETSPPDPRELRAFGKAYALWPADVALDAPITLSFPLPEEVSPSPRLSMYRSSGGGWSRVESSAEGGRLIVKTSRLGTFMAMEDATPPKLSDVLPTDNYKATSKRPYIKLKLSDSGSGIAKYNVYCGDQWLLAAYDPIRGTLEWLRDEELPSGEQTIRIEITDGAGNETKLKRAVRIP